MNQFSFLSAHDARSTANRTTPDIVPKQAIFLPSRTQTITYTSLPHPKPQPLNQTHPKQHSSPHTKPPSASPNTPQQHAPPSAPKTAAIEKAKSPHPQQPKQEANTKTTDLPRKERKVRTK
jgi:hypothetical protein